MSVETVGGTSARLEVRKSFGVWLSYSTTKLASLQNNGFNMAPPPTRIRRSTNVPQFVVTRMDTTAQPLTCGTSNLPRDSAVEIYQLHLFDTFTLSPSKIRATQNDGKRLGSRQCDV